MGVLTVLFVAILLIAALYLTLSFRREFGARDRLECERRLQRTRSYTVTPRALPIRDLVKPDSAHSPAESPRNAPEVSTAGHN